MTPALAGLLACPKDAAPLEAGAGDLRCPAGHRFPIIDGIPFLLRDDVHQPHWAGDLGLDYARAGRVPDAWRAGPAADATAVDAYVQEAIGATSGNLYGHLAGRLPRYPIPRFPLSPPGPRRLLDLGCSWGRWSLAAARAGYEVIGIDPQPEAVFAARRVARQLHLSADFLVADARYPPFRDGAIDQAFSFSVLQHLDEEAVRACAENLGRVLAPGGGALLQFASLYGVLSCARLAARGWRRARHFEVRYRRPSSLVRLFESAVGPAVVRPESFLSLNARVDDVDLLTRRGRLVVRASEGLRAAAGVVPVLGRLADSIWLDVCRRG